MLRKFLQIFKISLIGFFVVCVALPNQSEAMDEALLEQAENIRTKIAANKCQTVMVPNWNNKYLTDPPNYTWKHAYKGNTYESDFYCPGCKIEREGLKQLALIESAITSAAKSKTERDQAEVELGKAAAKRDQEEAELRKELLRAQIAALKGEAVASLSSSKKSSQSQQESNYNAWSTFQDNSYHAIPKSSEDFHQYFPQQTHISVHPPTLGETMEYWSNRRGFISLNIASLAVAGYLFSMDYLYNSGVALPLGICASLVVMDAIWLRWGHRP